MAARGHTDNASKVVNCIEKDLGLSFTEEQRAVFHVLETGGMSILQGDPGTGKTTVINGIAKAFRIMRPDGRLLLCAPTGSAAVRLKEITYLPASTLHKALGLKGFDGSAKAISLHADFIIIDEMSLCDTELCFHLLQSVSPGATILLCGDYHQIPSVGPGQVLRDLIMSKCCPVYRLTKPMRQGEGSLLVENAIAILKGKLLKPGREFQIFNVATDEAIVEAIERTGKDELPQILSPVKKSPAGTEALCQLVQYKQDYQDAGVWMNGIGFHVGDKVIMKANKYEAGMTYMNGDTGTISEINANHIKIKPTRQADEPLILKDRGFKDLGLSYALTYHKSQGLEYPEILIIVPAAAVHMASGELLYTAVTRAKKKVVILATKGILEAYLAAEGKSRRECGLYEMLVELRGGMKWKVS